MAKGYPLEEAGPVITRMVAEAADQPVTLTRHDRAVAYIFTPETLERWLETREILANPDAMQAIADDRAGLLKYRPFEEMERDLGDEA